MIICLDPGHGGRDPGATGPTGMTEKAINLKVAFTLRTILEQNDYDVVMTRASDKFVGLDERVKIANTCDMLLSIHCNSYHVTSVEGVETIYSKYNKHSVDLAGMVQGTLVKDPFSVRGHKDRGLKISPSPDYHRELYILKHTHVPAALVELEFISHPHWEKHLKSNAIPLASLLYTAIDRFAKIILS